MAKPFTVCDGCPRQMSVGEHAFDYVDASFVKGTSLLILTEAPTCDRYNQSAPAYKDDSGKVILNAVAALQKEEPYRNISWGYTYAVRCANNQGDPEPPKTVLSKCREILKSGLEELEGRPVILAMGMSALRALDIKAPKLKDVQGRTLYGHKITFAKGETELTKEFDVVVSISTKQLITMPGMYGVFNADLRRAADLAVKQDRDETRTALEELTRDYRLPESLEDVRAICDEILAYTQGEVDAKFWPIAVDTETNTKFAHKDSLQVLAVSFAWDTGKATAIPLFHKETAYDPYAALAMVVEVLDSSKPKFFHNAKYDLKVLQKKKWPLRNFVWDSMTGEHLLDEDKKGQYGLKPLTRTNFPEFAAYADALQELLANAEGDSQLDSIRKIEEAKERAERLRLKLLAKAAEPQKKKAKPPKPKKDKKVEEDKGFEDIPLKTLLLYAAIDADMTRRLVMLQEKRMVAETAAYVAQRVALSQKKIAPHPIPQICKEPNPLRTLARRNVFPVTPVLARMELRGVRIDRPYLRELETALDKVIADTAAELEAMCPDGLKLNSPADIADILFNRGYLDPETGVTLRYPEDGITKTKKGLLQTTEKVMQFIVAKYNCKFAKKKLIYAKAFKARNTFCRNVASLSELDGFLHTNYNQHGTSTGRLSSNDENMQNVPKKLANVNIKKIFVTTDDDMVFVNADAKGAEVRILTAYCQDKALIQSLNDGQDTHCFIASKIVELVRASPGAGEKLESMRLDNSRALTYEDFAARDHLKVTDSKYGDMLDKFRTAVKRVVFGILYGAGPKKIAETIGISVEQASVLIAMLFSMFPSIQKYIEATKWELKQFGLVETFFGRRRRYDLPGGPTYLAGKAERQGVNFKIQSTSSDIVMGRLVAIEEPLNDLGGNLLLTVHDSIGFEIKKKYLSQLPDFIHTHLEVGAAKAHPWLPVEFKWDYEVGPSYGELKPFSAYTANTVIKELHNDAAEAFSEEDVRAALAEA